jgi:hypothetical protein
VCLLSLTYKYKELLCILCIAVLRSYLYCTYFSYFQKSDEFFFVFLCFIFLSVSASGWAGCTGTAWTKRTPPLSPPSLRASTRTIRPRAFLYPKRLCKLFLYYIPTVLTWDTGTSWLISGDPGGILASV